MWCFSVTLSQTMCVFRAHFGCTDLNKQHTDVTVNSSRTTWLRILDGGRAAEGQTCWKHVGDDRWWCSSVTAQLWPSATLTTALWLCCEQVLTRLAASIHVTHDRPADLMETRDRIWNPRKSCLAGNCHRSIWRVSSWRLNTHKMCDHICWSTNTFL